VAAKRFARKDSSAIPANDLDGGRGDGQDLRRRRCITLCLSFFGGHFRGITILADRFAGEQDRLARRLGQGGFVVVTCVAVIKCRTLRRCGGVGTVAAWTAIPTATATPIAATTTAAVASTTVFAGALVGILRCSRFRGQINLNRAFRSIKVARVSALDDYGFVVACGRSLSLRRACRLVLAAASATAAATTATPAAAAAVIAFCVDRTDVLGWSGCNRFVE
jgi:hypothetical protein